MSGDEAMRQAYAEGKDLYCVIASKVFNNNYWDNLEFYREFSEVVVGDSIVIAGSDKKFDLTLDAENSITIPWCYLVETERGEVAASDLVVTDKIKSGDEFIELLELQKAENTNIDGLEVKNIKIIFKT
jgi:hypothetical protein